MIEALRRTTPSTTIEILTPDFRNKAQAAIEAIVAARPDVYNHNLETVPRLYPTIRPGARYYASLRLLESVKRHDPTIFTKSGVMVGLGEERLEVHQVMDDMRSADIDFLTMGQYLQPTPRHAKVQAFVEPATFNAYAAIARAKAKPQRRKTAPDPVAGPTVWTTRSFLVIWGELTDWWTHYDPAQLATELTDEQIEMFLTIAAGTTAFATALTAARNTKPSNAADPAEDADGEGGVRHMRAL